jgi:DNA-binding MarR family transcriptional regulator/N-acetylglutamate synthase-like GNAT family acetyltransferase
MTASAAPDPQRIAAVRRFNRFYTQRIGVLEQGLLRTSFSLAEARVLYELAHRDKPTATALAKDLSLDAGYLSRILRGFRRRGLIAREISRTDGRQTLLSLTERGAKAFAPLDTRTREQIALMLGSLPAAKQERLVAAMHAIEGLLEAKPETVAAFILRPHRPDDMGWVVARHGALYAEEYGWDETFEALVAEIAAQFIRTFDVKRECCWIAERDGEPVGCVFVVKQSARVAKLRLLIVDPKARGLGIGARLVEDCVRFARAAGYKKIILWTQSVLVSARRIYANAGFRLAKTEPHASFGHDLVGEYWELSL